LSDLDDIYHSFSFDFRINEVPLEELILHYERVNFLYPEKKKRIQHVLPIIVQNWKKALQAKDQLLWVASSHRNNFQKMATISLWRSTKNCWLAQHLTSNAGPSYVRNILIGTQLHAIENKYRAGQNWFQPKNKYANKIFGSIESSIGSPYAKVSSYNYYYLHPDINKITDSSISIVQCRNNYYQKTLLQFLLDTMGNVFIETEEWDQDDIELEQINDLYSKFDLFRYRSIWMAFNKTYGDEPVGVLTAYRGPLGFNFSLLENRMELILNSNLKNEKRFAIFSQLINKALSAYETHYPLKVIPLVIHSNIERNIESSNLEYIRTYNKSSWINKGFEPWCRHVAHFFEIIENNFKKEQNVSKE